MSDLWKLSDGSQYYIEKNDNFHIEQEPCYGNEWTSKNHRGKNKKSDEPVSDESENYADNDPVEVRAEVYKNILSIDELQDGEIPTQIKSEGRSPEEDVVHTELKRGILEAMQKLPPREKEFIECKFFKDKKLREIAIEYNISQSRISRIIQSGLDRIKKDLAKQGIL